MTDKLERPDLEQRAREMLADEEKAEGRAVAARNIRADTWRGSAEAVFTRSALRAITKALASSVPDQRFDRDYLGRKVREAWVRWALTQPNPKPSWLLPYDDLDEPDKEADRQIGEAMMALASSAPQDRGRIAGGWAGMSEDSTKPTMQQVVDYMLGIGPIEGMWWGEAVPERPRFWWRKHLQDAWQALTRAETPQSIPSEREEIVKWLRSVGDSKPHGTDWRAYYEAADAIEAGEHLTRQALEQGSAE